MCSTATRACLAFAVLICGCGGRPEPVAPTANADAAGDASADAGDAASPDGSASCASLPTCAACQDCALAGPCAGAFAACDAVRECSYLVDCETHCGTVTACLDGCRAAYPGGLALAGAFGSCMDCDVCGALCAEYCPFVP